MQKIPYEWILIISIVFVCILFLDAKTTDITSILPDANGTEPNVWSHVEPPEDRIRILWIIHSYVPFVNAGSEVCAHTVNRFLMSKPYKYDVWVACPGYPKQTYEGVRCFNLYDTETLIKVLRHTRILHSHSYIYRKQLMWLSKTTGIPYVEWVHTDNYVRSVPANNWITPSIRSRHWTVFNSISLRQSRQDVKDDHTFIFNPPVDYRYYSVEGRNPVYVTLSNVNENKGGKLLIALAKAMPDIQFQGILGGYRSQIMEESIPNLRYIKNTTRIRDIYAQTWVLIMPSREETWGRTAVEAMASGIPVIAAPTPGLRECCGNAALFCDRDDIDAWVTTIRRLRSDREYYNSRSAAAYARARALDPRPDLDNMEDWMNNQVLASSASRGRLPNRLEKLLLFR